MGKCVFRFWKLSKRSVLVGLGLLTAYFAESCFSENKTEQAAHAAGGIVATDTLAYQVVNFKDFSPYFSGTETSVDSTLFTAQYPVFQPEVQELVKRAIFIDGENTVEQVAESFLGGYNEYAEEQMDAGNGAIPPWFKHQHCQVVLNKPGILTLRNAINDYTGGAHGMEVELWFSYDVKQKKRLVLADVVQDSTQFLAIAEHHFRKLEQLSDTASYGAEYFFDSFALPENFGLTKDGILFHYNPYEIKSYAEGGTTLLVPYADVKDILTDRAKELLKAI
jgi:hypothetical protein